uniref:Putative secreted protein n=1 Tax=Ixodes ricinus TaxID=34613 RepID=A0A6B0UJC1_IXORI
MTTAGWLACRLASSLAPGLASGFATCFASGSSEDHGRVTGGLPCGEAGATEGSGSSTHSPGADSSPSLQLLAVSVDSALSFISDTLGHELLWLGSPLVAASWVDDLVDQR